MLLPISTPISYGVTLVRAVPEALIVQGLLVLFDGQRYSIQLQGGCGDLQVGQTLVLDFGNSGPSRCRAKVEAVNEEGVVLVPMEALLRKDRRYYPRVDSELCVEYRPITLGEGNPIGSAHLKAVGEAEFSTADPDVDISVTGIRFMDTSPIPVNTLVLLRLQLPPDSKFRGVVGEVVRIVEEDEDDYSIAVNFIDLQDETFDRLIEYIGMRQEEMLGIL